jgi:hypothetical protein
MTTASKKAMNPATSAAKADKITKLKIKHAMMTIHGKDGPGGSRIQFGYTKRLEAINQLARIGMDSPSAEVRKSVTEGLIWGTSDPAEPVSAAATKAMESIKQ